MIRAVIFDIGGVLFESPLEALLAFERDAGLTPGTIGGLVAATGADGAWARLERGELPFADFLQAFAREVERAGNPFPAHAAVAAVGGAMRPRPRMLAAVRSLREAGFTVAALTNNWYVDEAVASRFEALGRELHCLVESWRVGARKPEPAIYEALASRIDVPLHESVFLDDIGSNLKTARALGMTTIKVDDPEAALAELERELAPRWRRPDAP